MTAIKLKGEADRFIDLFGVLDIDQLYSPCLLCVTKDGVAVETFDIGKSTQLLLYFNDIDLEMSGEGKIPIEPETMLEVLSKKYANSKSVEITFESRKPIIISDDKGKENKVIPPSRKECRELKKTAIAKYDEEGYLLFAKRDKKGNVIRKGDDFEWERAGSKVLVTTDELEAGITDLILAGTDYVTFHFDPDGESSYCISGHWSKKSDTSNTPVEAEVEGKILEIVFPTMLKKMLDAFESDRNVEIQGNTGKNAVMLRQTYNHGELRFLLTQSQKPE